MKSRTIFYISCLLSMILWGWRSSKFFLCFLEDIELDFIDCSIYSITPVVLWICGFLLGWLVKRRGLQLKNLSYLVFWVVIILSIITPLLPRIEGFIMEKMENELGYEIFYEIFREYGLLIYMLSPTLLYSGLGFLVMISSKKEGN